MKPHDLLILGGLHECADDCRQRPAVDDPHALTAVLTHHAGVLAYCRCLDTFPTLASWARHALNEGMAEALSTAGVRFSTVDPEFSTGPAEHGRA